MLVSDVFLDMFENSYIHDVECCNCSMVMGGGCFNELNLYPTVLCSRCESDPIAQAWAYPTRLHRILDVLLRRTHYHPD